MKKFLYVFISFTFLLAACSAKEEQPVSTEKNAGKQEAVEAVKAISEEKEVAYKPNESDYYEFADAQRELTEFEKELLRYPGVYSGDLYDEKKVNEALDQLPDDLTQEQYLQEMLYLLAEDYHEELETLVNFDASVEVNLENPDETVDAPRLKTAHYAILIDASGSMKAASGNKTRMEAAKSAVMGFAKQVPENATVSLRVYGHKGTGSDADKEMSCASSENFYSGNFDNEKFQQALGKVKPAGWTPIALGLETVKEDFPENAEEIIVYVVSDGIETCDRDPVQVAKDLATGDIKTVVNIIGFDVDNAAQQLLKEVAGAGNGEFTYVNSEKDLKKYMRAQYEEIQQKWVEWKNAGKDQAKDIKQAKKDLAKNTKESMVEKAKQEKERMRMALEYLKAKFDDYNHPTSYLFSLMIDYENAKINYAIDAGNKALLDSINAGNEKIMEYINDGNEKIMETIKKKNEN